MVSTLTPTFPSTAIIVVIFITPWASAQILSNDAATCNSTDEDEPCRYPEAGEVESNIVSLVEYSGKVNGVGDGPRPGTKGLHEEDDGSFYIEYICTGKGNGKIVIHYQDDESQARRLTVAVTCDMEGNGTTVGGFIIPSPYSSSPGSGVLVAGAALAVATIGFIALRRRWT